MRTLERECRHPPRPARASGRWRLWGAGLGLALALAFPGATIAQLTPADTCAQGRIADIRVENGDVFVVDEAGNVVVKGFFGLMNALHVTTQPGFIESELLFRRGDCVDSLRLSESQRLLRNLRFIGSADIDVEDMDDGDKRVVVRTRDEWSTQVDLGVSYNQGVNVEVLEVTEENFLGRGLYLSGEYREYREQRDISLRLLTQRFFGRANANIEYGSTRAGRFGTQYIVYPFVGEVGRFAVREFFQRRTEYFRYATDDAEPFTHILMPVVEERAELSAARRFGRPGRYLMLGGSLTRDVYDFKRAQLAVNGNFGDPIPAPDGWADSVQAQVVPMGATRASVHVAARRIRFVEYRGLDALTGVRDVPLGVDFGLSVGKSLPVFEPREQRYADDLFLRGRIQSGVPVGPSLFLGQVMLESRLEDGEWRDILGEADLWLYGRTELLPYQTFFARASYSGGWNTTIPFQLSLGGRDAVRSLREDRYPSGRHLMLTLEDRIFHGWPHWSAADLGLTLFGDLGRVWAGDVPYGRDSPWQAALGVGLRIGLPAGSSKVLRMDFAFPVTGGQSGMRFMFSVFERHGLEHGFSEDLLRRSRRFEIGPEHFN